MNSMYFKSINQYTTEPVSITNDVKKKRQLKKRNPLCLKRDVEICKTKLTSIE